MKAERDASMDSLLSERYTKSALVTIHPGIITMFATIIRGVHCSHDVSEGRGTAESPRAVQLISNLQLRVYMLAT